MRRDWLALAVILWSASCRTVTPPEVEYALRVAIYPVASAETIAARVKTEFERAYPMYSVTVTVADAAGLYDVPTLAGWLAGGKYDLVEADMVLLDAVRKKLAEGGKHLPTWTYPPYPEQWIPALAAASTIGGQIYGVPHYGCGYFLFTTDQTLASIPYSPQFFAALNAVTGKKKHLIAMNVDGGVTTGAVYLNAWSSQYGNITGALAPPYNNPPLIATMKNITTACLPNQTGSDSPCLNGTFRNNVDRQAFIAGDANTFVGFSESLRPIREAAPATQFYVAPAPLGRGAPLLLYSDSLLKRVDCTSDPCAAAATAFAEYYLRPSTYQWLLLGEDISGNRIPRYLVPGTRSGWPSTSDPYYRRIQASVTNTGAFPNETFYDVRSDMRTEIQPLIKP
jgi:thiamine pyridinylase